MSGALSSQNPFHSIARNCIKKEKEKKGEKEYGDDLEDGPLVVVPDDIADGLEGIEEPHEGGVWPGGLLQPGQRKEVLMMMGLR